jgi:16S rRNA (uracil1498-N3)-methyltransferase
MKVLVPAGTAAPDALVPLDDDEAHHLRVRRAMAGATVELRDGAGLSGTGVLEGGASSWAVRVGQVERTIPAAALVLAVGAGDRDRCAWLPATPTERTASVATRVQAKHAERLARRALESIKQSGALWSPRVLAPMPLGELLRARTEGARWIADPEGAPPPASVTEAVTVLIGPEGGFTAGERAAAAEAGWQAVRLGPHVLRFETAAVAAAACVAAARERTSS